MSPGVIAAVVICTILGFLCYIVLPIVIVVLYFTKMIGITTAEQADRNSVDYTPEYPSLPPRWRTAQLNEYQKSQTQQAQQSVKLG